jgi:hypothetical protein
MDLFGTLGGALGVLNAGLGLAQSLMGFLSALGSSAPGT